MILAGRVPIFMGEVGASIRRVEPNAPPSVLRFCIHSVEDALKEVELENLSARIREAQSINDRRAQTLNKVRVAAALTPFVFSAAALLAYADQLKPAPAEPKAACSSTASAPSGATSTCKK